MNLRKIFFSLLRAELNGETVSAELLSDMTDADYARLYKLSKAQDLAHLIGDGLLRSGISLPEDMSQAFSKQHLFSVYRCERIRDVYDRVCALFEDAGIDFMPLKGAVIRPYYPEPWMRTSCDIDILIHEADIDRATKLILSNFSVKNEGERNYHDVSFFLNKNVNLELHFNILENLAPMDAVLSRVWEYSTLREGTSHCYLQSNEFLMFHVVAHNAYHFIRGGCGVRPFMDWWILKRAIAFDEKVFAALLKEAKLSDFAMAMDALADVWFSDTPYTEFVRVMDTYVLGAGAYGTEKNATIVAREKSGSKVKYFFTRIFPPFHKLTVIYPSLRRFPFLYPFYIVARWFRTLFIGRGRRAMVELRVAATPEDERSRRITKMFRDLKLIQ